MSRIYRLPVKVTLILFIAMQSFFAAGCATRSTSGSVSVEYIPDASYYLLMAEIALQRKEYLTAAEEYLNAAGQSTDPELAARSTEFAFEYGFDAFAMSSVRRWLELDPESPRANEYAGLLYLERNDIERALHHWQLALGPVSARTDEDYLGLGRDLAAADNVAGATTVLIRLSIEAPESAGLRLALAQAALRSGAHELALGSAGKAADDDAEWLQPQIVIAWALLSMGAKYEALEHMDELRERSPTFGVELEYVQLLSAAGRTEAALNELAELIKGHGVQAELVRMHALISLAAGELKAATRDFEWSALHGGDVYESFFYRAQIAATRGDQRQAIEFLSRIAGGPYLLPAQFRTSQAYAELDEHQAGLDYLDAFAEDYPRHAVDILEARARLLHDMGRTDEALLTYDAMLRFRPDTVDLLLARALLLDEEGRVDEAIQVMERAVEIAPDNAAALNSLGYTLVNRNRSAKKGYRLIRLALELEPDSPAIIDSMGWVLFRLGRIDEARSYLEQAYSMLDDPELVAHLGEVLWVTGERERATELWDQAIATNPDSKPLIEVRARLLSE